MKMKWNKDEIEIKESDESMQAGEPSDSEKEIQQKLDLRRKRMRILSGAESENETNITRSSKNNIGRWTTLEVGGYSGRYPIRKIFKDISGYAKRTVMEGNVSSAFHLIITKNMIQHIKSYTEEEARCVLKEDSKTSTTKFLTFIGILYARGAYEANSLNSFYLSSKEWRPAFFSSTMPRDEFMQILRFVRFDKKKERSKRLRTDKFAMISEICNM
uniref:DDE_Tnp_1_7 domain-containing protein n=1 Tax=Glossina austeni TaxID=7395 RepID=A0A1A9UYC2_GLOAU